MPDQATPAGGDLPRDDLDVRKPVSAAAQRALDEAAARRAALDAQAAALAQATEINGRGGPEPVRYGDWENKGLASDF